LSIDINVSERTFRHGRSGEKNWLFVGSRQAGPRAAVSFTILAGAKRHRIEPWNDLCELLLRLHDDDPRLDEMLPDQRARQHPEPCSPTGSRNPAANRPLEVVAAVTHEQ
jgi:transposase